MTYNGARLTAPADSDPGDVIDAALAFSRANIPVFPTWGVVPDGSGGWVCSCTLGTASTDNGHKPGKHPATAHGHNDAALVTEDRARSWFVDNGAKNLALPTGNGLVVLDFDPKNGGHEVYDDWDSWTNGVSLPETLTLTTGSGGLHLYYLVPTAATVTSRTAALPGVDIQSNGRYVVGPTARHISGNIYQWRDPERPVASLSSELLSWMMTRTGGFSAGGETPEHFDVRAGFVKGQRDAYANTRAFQLRKAGISRERAEQAMRQEWEAAEQTEGDYFGWDVVLEKLDRVWADVTPDIPSAASVLWAQGINAASAGIASGAVPLQPRQNFAVTADNGDPMDNAPDDADPGDGHQVHEGDVLDAFAGGESMSETGNAARYVRLFRDQCRYVPTLGQWHVWNGSVLAPDKLNTALRLTEHVPRDIREYVILEVNEANRRAGEKWAMTSESMATRRATLAGAALEMSVDVADLDSDPWVLCVQNGTVNLRSGELRSSRISDLSTKRAAVVFDTEAQCPRWEAHIDLVTGHDKNLSAYLQRAAGYTLTGLVSEQKFFFLFGDGQNGKNVFTETLLGMLGDYGQIAAPGLLTNADDHPTALAELRGARMVMHDETQMNRPFNDGRVKMLTGSSQVRGRFMGKDFFTYESTMKLWVLGNAKPVIKDTSAGMWRRMQLVPFTQTIPDSQRIMRYEELLREEWSGILNWALAGLRSWIQLERLDAPEAVSEAVKVYRTEEDSLGQWMRDRLEQCPGAQTVKALAYQDYQMWMTYQGYAVRDQLNNVHFGRALTARGVATSETDGILASGKRGKIRYYDDVRLPVNN